MDNNVWVVGDDDCVVIDVPHDAGAIRGLVGNRRVQAILASHAHDDHVRVAPTLAELLDAPVWLHPNEVILISTCPTPSASRTENWPTARGSRSPGSRCWYCTHPATLPERYASTPPVWGAVFTGDTLFAGSPGATGRSYSDFGVIVKSIRTRLPRLPDMRVHPGHGGTTTIGAEKPHVQEWPRRGH